MNELLMTADAESPSLLIHLDLSAAFDIVDHTILLGCLHTTIGLSDSVLKWFQSYFSCRTVYVSLGGCRSRSCLVISGVLQELVLSSILLTLYIFPLRQVISRHGMSLHCYADDTQLYIITPNRSAAMSRLNTCLKEIKDWMTTHFLQLNSSKTEALLVGTPHQV